MSMRILLFLVITTTTMARAQQDDAIIIGGAGAFTGGASFIDGTAYPLLGGRGGFLIDQRFLIGGGGASGWGSVTTTTGQAADLNFGYGGLLLGWWPLPEARVRPMVDLLIGGGGYEQREHVSGDLYHLTDRGGFTMEANAGLLIRLHQHIRLSLSASWRNVAIDDALLNTPSVMTGIWLGSF